MLFISLLFQTLAIYDRFGRLMLGDEEEPRDVLEYLVMERHLVNPYGLWRLHGKIVPAWAPPKEPILKVCSFKSHSVVLHSRCVQDFAVFCDYCGQKCSIFAAAF